MLSIPACLGSEGSLERAMKGEAHLGWITGWCSGFYSYRFLHVFSKQDVYTPTSKCREPPGLSTLIYMSRSGLPSLWRAHLRTPWQAGVGGRRCYRLLIASSPPGHGELLSFEKRGQTEGVIYTIEKWV